MSLLSRLSKIDKTPPSAPTCAFKKSCSKCHSTRYLLGRQGAYGFATLCICVESCLACHGRGWDLVKDNDKSGVHACKSPHPQKIVSLLNSAKIPARYKDAQFASFKNRDQALLAQVNKVKNWCDQYSTSSLGLILSGPVGVGKTYLLACLVKTLAERGFSVKMVDFFQLINEVKACFSGDVLSENEILKPLIDVDVLVIDELGKGRNTDFEITVLDQLIMGRYNQNKTIVASTNYTFENPNQAYQRDLTQGGFSQHMAVDRFGPLEERVGSRIFSRLIESTYSLELRGQDYRRVIAEQRSEGR